MLPKANNDVAVAVVVVVVVIVVVMLLGIEALDMPFALKPVAILLVAFVA